jgi:hypothetical protein
MQLSEHFSLEELTFSDTAARHGIDNVPTDDETLNNLTRLAKELENVRQLLGFPIHINSAFRSLSVNALVGSKPTSYHTKGLAADIVCPQFGTPKDIVQKIIDSDIEYDQIIWEFNSWCHIGFAQEGQEPRKQKLTINKDGTTLFKE